MLIDVNIISCTATLCHLMELFFRPSEGAVIVTSMERHLNLRLSQATNTSSPSAESLWESNVTTQPAQKVHRYHHQDSLVRHTTSYLTEDGG